MLLLASLALALSPAPQDSPSPDTASEAAPPGPIAPEEWKILRPREGDTIALMRGERGFLVEDTIVQASPRTALICYETAGPFRDLVVRNSILRVEPGTLPLDRAYWGVRGYDLIDARFERVEITGFGKVTAKHDEGHALYLNLAGSLTLEQCYIHGNGGQGLQVVDRPRESELPPGPAAGTITIRDTVFAENGFNPDRGSFQVSIFGTGQDVLLERVEITAGQDDRRWPRNRTGGGLLIEPEAFRRDRPESNVWWRPKVLPPDFETPFTQGKVELIGVTVRHRSPNRALVQIKGCRELIVQGCTFEGGRVSLDDPQKSGRACGTITWQGNRGDADVFHRGRRIGRADEDFRIGD